MQSAENYILAGIVIVAIILLIYVIYLLSKSIDVREKYDFNLAHVLLGGRGFDVRLANNVTRTEPEPARETVHEIHPEPEIVPEPEIRPEQKLVPNQKQDQKRNREGFFENLQYKNHNNDEQNVHNSIVVRDISTIFRRLEELNARDFPRETETGMTAGQLKSLIIDEVFAEINKFAGEYRGDRIDSVKMVLQEISKGASISSLSEREDWVMCQIWRRTNSPENIDVRQQLQEAFIDGLLDCVRPIEANLLGFLNFIDADGMAPFAIECIQGRISRMISTFTLLDNDLILSKPIKDDKEYENEAYSKASAILIREKANKRGLFKENIWDLYCTEEDKLSPGDLKEVKKFEAHVKKCIENELLTDYSKILKIERLKEIISSAQSGI